VALPQHAQLFCVVPLLLLASDTRLKPRNNRVLFDDTVSC